MKKYLFSLIFLLVSYVGFSQKGLSYQAVILDPAKIEVPGQDISGQPLVNGDVWLKFSISNGSTLQFEEVQKTKTDNYGLVNLLIGSVSSASFNSLVWDGSQKSLQVFVSFNQGGSYTKIADQKLTYNPYSLFSETAGKLVGTLAISGGGTGATTAADARANLGLDQVNNTSDAAKPVSTATQTALNLKANKTDLLAGLASKADTAVIKAYVDAKIVSSNSTISNQSSSSNISSTALAAKADTAYVLAKFAAATIADADATTKGKIKLTGDLNGTADAPTVPGLALKANVTDLVTLTSNVNVNTASIASNSAAIISEASTARAAELVLTNNVAANTASITSNATNLVGLTTTVVANTASITANTNAITSKAPIASPVFTGTVARGTSTPSSAAILDITSTSKGLLLPRLTFAQKSAIVSPEAGLILWCSDCGTNGELQVYNGTNFVNMVGANAQFALPSVSSTAPATSITSSTLTSGGVIDADGGAFVTARGIVWNTNTNPSVSLSTKTTDGTGIGTFSSAITGLTSGVTYYVRAYATNSVGTKYGPEISVNTAAAVATLATTTAASSIGANTATSGGNIIYNGGASVSVSGLVWSTTSTPTTSDSKTTNGAASGSFTSNLTGLTPGTIYYVRSYATNSIGTSYGAQTSFTTLNTATISATAPATSITSATATTGGTITSDGGASVTARGIVWNTSIDPIISLSTKTTDATGTGTYTSSLVGLSPATVYYYRSYATNSVGTVYGPQASFTTNAIAPTLTTIAASGISKYAASAGGTILSNGGTPVTISGICWGNTTTPTTSNNKTTDGTTSGTFTSSITGLTAGTTYYVRAYATNAIGTSYGTAQSFTTLTSVSNVPVLANTTTATGISTSTATLGGNVTDEGATQVSVRGLVYGTSSNSSTFSVTNGSGVGTFSNTLTGLIQGTTYYVRSFATNVQGTGYGAETSFSTQTTPTLSATATPTSLTTSSAVGGGTISSTGGSTVLTSGLVWDASANPTIALSTKTTDGATTGTFTSSITGLTQGATYHVRAYATNSVGTNYGPDITFTTLTTPTVSATATISSITGTTATGGGTISSDGGTAVTARGLVWGTSSGASTYSVTTGTGTGTYTSSLTGLGLSTTYYVRAFATNNVGTIYGPEVTFSTPSTATLASTITSTITSYTAILGGVLSSTGGAVTSIGIKYSTDINFGTYSTTIINANASAGTYTSTISGLSASTTYYAKAYATNIAGTTEGPRISFTTPVPPVAVGDYYGGGVVFYILKSGDSGYDANVQHGLIATKSNLKSDEQNSSGVPNPVLYTQIAKNGNSISGAQNDGTLVGKANTDAIIADQGLGTYVFKYVRETPVEGYNDWYIPSIKELNLFRTFLFSGKYAGGAVIPGYYWVNNTDPTNKYAWGTYISSTQYNSGNSTKPFRYYTNYFEGNGLDGITYDGFHGAYAQYATSNMVYQPIRSF
jgi:hypothetical protein